MSIFPAFAAPTALRTKEQFPLSARNIGAPYSPTYSSLNY